MKSRHKNKKPSVTEKPEEKGVEEVPVENKTIDVNSDADQENGPKTFSSLLGARNAQYYLSIFVYAGIIIASILIFLFIKKNS